MWMLFHQGFYCTCSGGLNQPFCCIVHSGTGTVGHLLLGVLPHNSFWNCNFHNPAAMNKLAELWRRCQKEEAPTFIAFDLMGLLEVDGEALSLREEHVADGAHVEAVRHLLFLHRLPHRSPLAAPTTVHPPSGRAHCKVGIKNTQFSLLKARQIFFFFFFFLKP